MSAGKSAAITFAAWVLFGALFFGLTDIEWGTDSCLLAGSFTLIVASVCALYVYDSCRETR